MTRRIHVRALEPEDPLCRQHGENLRNRIHTSLGANAIADDPAQADTVVLLPSFRPAYHRYGRLLLDDPVVTRNFDRCFVFDSADRPVDFLRGCYVSAPQKRFDLRRQRSIGFLYHEDSSHTREVIGMRPTRLFSFHGAASHPVRRRIVDQLAPASGGAVGLTGKWLTHTRDEYEAYWRQLGSSRFVLCPRGLGTSTIRVQETMQAGRVPVIIADGWVPPAGPDWPAFSLRVPEGEIAGIPDLLRGREDDAAEMGRAARAAWERYYEPGSAFVPWLLALLDELRESAAVWSAEEERRRWSTPGFRWSQGIDPIHRAPPLAKAAVARARRSVRAAIDRAGP